MATAHVEHAGKQTCKRLRTTEDAAGHLALLLRMHGFKGDPVPHLVSGKRVAHKGFVYWVSG